MNQETAENVGQEIDGLAQKYQDQLGLSYSDALKKVAREKPALWARYNRGESQPNPKDAEGAEEFSRRIVAYSEHFTVDKSTAESMVREHDPEMRKYSKQGGSTVMSTEQVPLSAESVVDSRARERMAKGEVKEYAEAIKAVLADDPHLAVCYQKNLPYIEAARKYVEYPMASAEVRAITEPRPDAIVTPSPERPAPEFTNTARLRLGAMLAGAKGPDGGIDIARALQIAGLVPDEVRGAASEALDELTRAMINRRGMRGATSQAYPEAYRLAVAEHPALWAASQTGTLTEEGLKDLFIQWFK